MARFRFRLQPVLDVRARVVDERQREHAVAARELAEAQALLASFIADREARRADLTREHRSFDVDTLRTMYGHLAYLDRAIDEQTVCVAACQADVERAMQRLVAANTDRKVLETLRTRRFEAFAIDASHAEQREIDDQNARRYGRAQAERGDQV